MWYTIIGFTFLGLYLYARHRSRRQFSQRPPEELVRDCNKALGRDD